MTIVMVMVVMMFLTPALFSPVQVATPEHKKTYLVVKRKEILGRKKNMREKANIMDIESEKMISTTKLFVMYKLNR